MDRWNLLIFGVIPLLAVAIVFLVKRRSLWLAPIISSASVLILYIINFLAHGVRSPLVTIFTSSERRWFFLLVMLTHLAIVLAMTAVAYLVAYLLKRNTS